jgi:hypothetical protein
MYGIQCAIILSRRNSYIALALASHGQLDTRAEPVQDKTTWPV